MLACHPLGRDIYKTLVTDNIVLPCLIVDKNKLREYLKGTTIGQGLFRTCIYIYVKCIYTYQMSMSFSRNNQN